MSDFLYAKFEGKRFDLHQLPYELLPDIFAYASLIEKLAQHIYKEKTGKKKVPKDFRDRFKLVLGQFKPGSTIAPLVRELPSDYSHAQASSDEFSLARDIVNKVIASIGSSQPLPKAFPEDLLPYFLKFGKGLLEGEKICFSQSENFASNIVVYDQSVRRAITSLKKTDYSSVCNIVGKLDGIEVSRRKIKLILQNEKEIWLELKQDYYKYLFDSAKNFSNLDNEKKEKCEVRVFGLASFTKDDTISSIDDVQHMIVYEGESMSSFPNIPNRIEEIKSLQDNWFQDDESKKFESSKLYTVKNALELLVLKDLPSPFIYPCPDSEITCEWTLGRWDLSATINFEEDKVFLHALNLDNRKVKTEEFHLENEAVLSAELGEFLNEYLPGADEVEP